MHYIHGFIGLVLIVLALIHVPYPEPLQWLPYTGAAILALLTLVSDISIPVSRLLAIATAGVMFFFFAAFFLIVPKLTADWYLNPYGWEAVSRILGAFVMIPILSDYSCRLKADCLEAREARRSAFFSAPSDVRTPGR
jgi:energy-coupling factor transporter transmembrane protein EcfT